MTEGVFSLDSIRDATSAYCRTVEAIDEIADAYNDMTSGAWRTAVAALLPHLDLFDAEVAMKEYACEREAYRDVLYDDGDLDYASGPGMSRIDAKRAELDCRDQAVKDQLGRLMDGHPYRPRLSTLAA